MSDDNILEILRDYTPPKKLHPIAATTYDAYAAAGRELTPEIADDIREQLAAYGDDLKALTDALCGLAAFMIYVSENLDDQATGEKVAAIIKEVGPRYEPLENRAVRALQDLAKKTKGLFDRFVDKDKQEEARAPVYGEKAPEGSVPASTFKPVAQPPPWAKKKK